MAPPVKSGPRFDNMINVPKVRVIDDEGENLGVMFTREAIEQANEKGLNLVEVSPNADPPVCKYLDVGKFRYEAQKKANLARKSQKTQDIKEVKMRPNIDTHDYEVKMRNVTKFIDNGDKVRIAIAKKREKCYMPDCNDEVSTVADRVEGDRLPLNRHLAGEPVVDREAVQTGRSKRHDQELQARQKCSRNELLLVRQAHTM
jgi:translation initiation factor IF-3